MALPAASAAFDGAATAALWRRIVGPTLPTVSDRAHTLLLTFESTDYTEAQWNFCQNRPFYDPPQNPVCYSNDPGSFLTWGPHGATAGWGREVQVILAGVARRDEALLTDAFAGESAAVLRLLRVPRASTERYLCHIWTGPDRRRAWLAGFERLGRSPLVREIYDAVYASVDYDGGKVQRFHGAWEAAGLTPTAVDYAFFVDRSAHMSIAQGPITAALADAAAGLEGDASLSPAQARRAVAVAVRPGNDAQRASRLGRDVTFYIDALGEQVLTDAELTAWRSRGAVRAADVGLLDQMPAPAFAPGASIDWVPDRDEADIPAGDLACPPAVLSPQPPQS